MKKHLLPAALCALLVLSGCSSMLERSYVSSETHVDYFVTEDESILRAENYQGLVSSLMYFITEHSPGGTIRLYNYTGDVEADLEDARNEVLHEDPLGAYAVRQLRCDSTRILTYYEVTVSITYSRSMNEVEAIRPVSGMSALRQELKRLTTQYQAGSTLRTSYFTGDADLVSDLFWLAFYNNPSATQSQPRLFVTFYPEEGPQRILEVRVSWLKSADQMTAYGSQLSDAALQLLDGLAPAGERWTVGELAALLRSVLVYDPSGSRDALSALQGQPVNDLGALLAMEVLCQQAGLDVTVVADSAGAQLWLIVSTPSGYRHLLPRDLRPDSEQTLEWQLPLYTDEQLTALGFAWPTELHPTCVDYSGPVLE